MIRVERSSIAVNKRARPRSELLLNIHETILKNASHIMAKKLMKPILLSIPCLGGLFSELLLNIHEIMSRKALL